MDAFTGSDARPRDASDLDPLSADSRKRWLHVIREADLSDVARLDAIAVNRPPSPQRNALLLAAELEVERRDADGVQRVELEGMQRSSVESGLPWRPPRRFANPLAAPSARFVPLQS